MTKLTFSVSGDRVINRRALLKGLAGAAVVTALPSSAPAIHIRRRPKLHVLGTDVTLQEEIRLQAEKDLGIEITFEPKGSAGVLQKASTRPEHFDIYEQWSNSINILWSARAIQPIDKTRIDRWSEINSLSKTGKLHDKMPIGAGDAPHKLLHIQPDGTLGQQPSQWISFLPYVHNVDSFGYDTSVIPEGTAYASESWGWLLDDRYRGKVGLVNEPTIGIFDLALAVKARGLMDFENLGNLSRNEIDQLFDILKRYKRRGHFGGIWNSVPQSVQFMQQRRVFIESMFSPAVSTLNGEGIPVRYAAPREGYRGWHGVMCLSSKTSGETLDAAYDYMNWWLDGWAGAYMTRQGYYISVQDQAYSYLSTPERRYWYEGLPAQEDLRGANGRVAVKKGQTRSGGSYLERFSHVAVWNTVMDTYEYSLLRWYELLTA